jgi:hypothetical protein
MLAEKMGESALRQTMASGLAGGIGLCGGACGALGAAIWIRGMRAGDEEKRKLDFKDPDSLSLIEHFLKMTDYEFECSAIVGRTFEDVADHAAWLREGGCSELLDALAAHRSAD